MLNDGGDLMAASDNIQNADDRSGLAPNRKERKGRSVATEPRNRPPRPASGQAKYEP
jgi:hypothetical protein